MTATVIALMLIGASSSPLSTQERPVPKDSARLSISGCARGRVFTVRRDPEHESRGVLLEEGMKIRLEGDKKMLDEIKAHESSVIEITGLMNRSEMTQPGIGLAGGRVRITPVMPAGRAAGRDPGPPPAIIDVESYRLLNASCPR
ncbi:MAG: hypothetical protein FJW22_17500 [Acidimicrobiia bacterium]|nr:hypothetical protein [Acidimicrobiia bacterium]